MANEILFKNMTTPGFDVDIESYLNVGGYEGLKKALTLEPDAIIDIVKESGLRGRGGAGFPAGLKWSFIPKGKNLTKYLCCNADEGEPGTFKDRQLMEKDPHQLIEGMIITCYAIAAQSGYIYVRGELVKEIAILDKAIAEAYEKGFLGKNILGSDFCVDIYTHPGAGAYICGEETALIESLEGKRGQPRLKPPFPAISGLYNKPTLVNNVETLSNIQYIVAKGAKWYRSFGTEKSAGTKLFSVSGHVNKPGNYEISMGMPLKELIYDVCGGIPNGKALKGVIPGGSSTPVLPPDKVETVNLDYESIAEAGSMLGSGAIIVMDESVCMVGVALKLTEFYYHESCGKCTPCREGSYWMLQILRRIENGQGKPEDLDTLKMICSSMTAKTFCPFGDAEVGPVMSTLEHYRDEYEAHIRDKCCSFTDKWAMV